MRKKLFLILIAGFFVFGLSGCAKNSSAPAFHNNKYYLKHKKTAAKVYNFCNKNYKGWKNTLPRREFSKWGKEWTNCSNAGFVVVNGN
ncbi:MAG: hypothetical protein ACYCT7_04210 [bacterium]